MAVVEALKLAKGKEVNIYTDSAYTVGAAHVELRQWMRAGFRTAGNKPIKHEAEMRELAKALQGPERVAIIKCRGHVEYVNSTIPNLQLRWHPVSIRCH